MGLAAFVKESTQDQQVKGIKKNPAWTAMAMLKKRGHSEQKKERVDKTSTKTERWWEIIKGARRYENQRVAEGETFTS